MPRAAAESPRDSPATVAIIEDEPVLRTELAFQLDHLGFAVATFQNAAQFYRYIAVQAVQIAVIDIGLDGEDGLSICRHLRAHDPRLGIVFTTARALRGDRLVGLAAGADAYLVKPVDLDELVLILQRLQARGAAAVLEPPEGSAGDWRLNGEHGLLLTTAGHRLRLSVSEFGLLRALFRAVGRACPHAELAEAIGLLPEEHDKHRVEVIFSRLRARVQRETGRALPITAVRGFGYRFEP